MKRSKSSKNQSNKRPRRSLRIGQQQCGPFWTENTNDTPTESSNQLDTSSIPDWLNIPFLVWDHQLIKFLGLKQIAIMRGVNRFFEPCWVRRFKLNLLPLRVPYDIGTLDRAMRVMEILIDRKPYSKENPLVVELDKGEHQITSSWTDPEYINIIRTTTLSITRNNITFVGRGIDQTTILGGFAIENFKNITFKQMTVTNTSSSCRGIRMDNAKVELTNVALKGCEGFALSMNASNSVTTLVAKNCEFANSICGAVSAGRFTSAKFNNCVFHDNSGQGLQAEGEATIHLHGEATAIHSNGSQGILAMTSSKILLHLPSHHKTSYNNDYGMDRITVTGATITNVED